VPKRLPIVEVSRDLDAFVQAASVRIADSLAHILQKKTMATLVLTGGNTPKPIYQVLASEPYKSRIDWKRVHIFWGDERCVSPESPESNYGMARDSLISSIDARPDNVHRILGELDAEQAANLYEQEIIRTLPGPGVPSFDLALLGMGDDGHTASLFPGSEWDEERLVIASVVPQSGAKRISMTPRILNAAAKTIFLVSGRNKADALACVLENPACNYPAARIHPTFGNLFWMLDASAASLLTHILRHRFQGL
jgi:6-phosphogluconolactonase